MFSLVNNYLRNICDALHDLVSFVQFKKPEKHPWRNVTVTKITLLHERFFAFLKLCKASYIDTDFFNLSILTARIYALKDINDKLGNRFDNEDIEDASDVVLVSFLLTLD